MNPKRSTVARMVLFSASEQIRCTPVICNSEWVTSFMQCILNIYPSGCSTVWLLHGWFHVKLLLSRHKFCVHHTTMHQITVSLFEATPVGCIVQLVDLTWLQGSFVKALHQQHNFFSRERVKCWLVWNCLNLSDQLIYWPTGCSSMLL